MSTQDTENQAGGAEAQTAEQNQEAAKSENPTEGNATDSSTSAPAQTATESSADANADGNKANTDEVEKKATEAAA